MKMKVIMKTIKLQVRIYCCLMCTELQSCAILRPECQNLKNKLTGIKCFGGEGGGVLKSMKML